MQMNNNTKSRDEPPKILNVYTYMPVCPILKDIQTCTENTLDVLIYRPAASKLANKARRLQQQPLTRKI